MPDFLRSEAVEANLAAADLRDGFALTAYFLERDVFAPRGIPMPDARRAYLAEIIKG